MSSIASGSPLVSVLLPVYNGADYIREAIQSILDQTYDNFELIIIDDGSTDESVSVIQEFNDPRIRFYNQINQGLPATLNRAVGLAKGEYLARQDHDDISMPQRFEKQVAFLENHPNYGMVGTWAEIWEGKQKTARTHKHPPENLILQFELLFDNPFVHSSMMIRKEVFEKVGLYSTDTSRQPPEDYELWSRVGRTFAAANLPEILHAYREVPNSMSRVGPNPFLDRVVNISAENITHILGKAEPDQEIINLAALAHGAYHRLSATTDFSTVQKLLLAAADKLCASCESQSDIFAKVVKKRLHVIRSYYLKYRYGKVLGRAMSLIYRLGV